MSRLSLSMYPMYGRSFCMVSKTLKLKFKPQQSIEKQLLCPRVYMVLRCVKIVCFDSYGCGEIQSTTSHQRQDKTSPTLHSIMELCHRWFQIFKYIHDNGTSTIP